MKKLCKLSAILNSKKYLFSALLFLITYNSFGQIPAGQDTVISGSSTSFTPQYRYQTGAYGRLFYLYNPQLGKYDFIPSSKYLRAFYLPINNPTSTGTFTSSGDINALGSSIFTPTITGSSGTNTPPFIYSPTVNQTGTANYNLFRISPYMQSVGGNEGGSKILDIGYRSAPYPGGTHTSLFTFDRLGNFGAAASISTGNSALDGNGLTTNHITTNGVQSQGSGSIEGVGGLFWLKPATMGTNAYQGMPTASLTDYQAGYIGIPTFRVGNAVTGSVVTIHDASTMTIEGPPVAYDSNTILTNPWTFRVKAGNSYFGGNVRGLLPPSNPLDLVNKRSLDSVSTMHVSTISALQAYTGGATTIIVTDSLRGGIFNYDASLAKNDGGIYFTATGKGSGTWVRNYDGGEVYPEWWGAVPDYNPVTHSGTDNRAAIQSAIDSRPHHGGIVHVSGRFSIADSLKIGENCVIMGDNGLLPYQIYNSSVDTGRFAVASEIHCSNASANTIGNEMEAVAYRAQRINIKNILISGASYAGGGAKACISINNNPNASPTYNAGTSLLLLENVFFEDAHIGLNMNQSAGGATARDCHFAGLDIGATDGMGQLKMLNSWFWQLKTRAIDAVGYEDIIDGNKIEPNSQGDGSEGIYLHSASYTTYPEPRYTNIQNNTFDPVTKAIRATAGYNLIISNNQVVVATDTAFVLKNLNQTQVYGNVMQNRSANQNFPYIYDLNGGTVKLFNNTFVNPAGYTNQYGILVDGGTALVGSGNTGLTAAMTGGAIVGTANSANMLSETFYSDMATGTVFPRTTGKNIGLPTVPYGNVYANNIFTPSGSVLNIYTQGGNSLFLGANNATRWSINGATYQFQPVADNSYDIGSASNRVRKVYATDYRTGLTGLLKGNGASSDVTAISGTSSQFVMGDGSLATALPNGTTATTQSTSDNSTKVATTAYVKAQSFGTGTVTSVGTGYGLSGGAITTTGTIAVDTTAITTRSYADRFLTSTDTALNSFNWHGQPYLNTSFTGTPSAMMVNDGTQWRPGTAASVSSFLGLTATELGYVSGATSNLQTQLDAKVNKTGNETISGQKHFTDNAQFDSSVSVDSLISLTGNLVQATNSAHTNHLISLWGGNGSFEPSFGWSWLDSGTGTSIVATQATSNRTITIPDASGTVALTSDITASAANPYSTSATPSIVVNGTHAGTGYTVTITGTNQDGVITLTTGTAPSGVGGFMTVTMSGSFAYPTTCVPILMPANSTALGLVGHISTPSSSTTSFDISTDQVLAGSTIYKWNYHNGGY